MDEKQRSREVEKKHKTRILRIWMDIEHSVMLCRGFMSASLEQQNFLPLTRIRELLNDVRHCENFRILHTTSDDVVLIGESTL